MDEIVPERETVGWLGSLTLWWASPSKRTLEAVVRGELGTIRGDIRPAEIVTLPEHIPLRPRGATMLTKALTVEMGATLSILSASRESDELAMVNKPEARGVKLNGEQGDLALDGKTRTRGARSALIALVSRYDDH